MTFRLIFNEKSTDRIPTLVVHISRYPVVRLPSALKASKLTFDGVVVKGSFFARFRHISVYFFVVHRKWARSKKQNSVKRYHILNKMNKISFFEVFLQTNSVKAILSKFQYLDVFFKNSGIFFSFLITNKAHIFSS